MTDLSETALYWSMYSGVFNAVSDAIVLLEQGETSAAKAILIHAQQNAEEKYIENH